MEVRRLALVAALLLLAWPARASLTHEAFLQAMAQGGELACDTYELTRPVTVTSSLRGCPGKATKLRFVRAAPATETIVLLDFRAPAHDLQVTDLAIEMIDPCQGTCTGLWSAAWVRDAASVRFDRVYVSLTRANTTRRFEALSVYGARDLTINESWFDVPGTAVAIYDGEGIRVTGNRFTGPAPATFRQAVTKRLGGPVTIEGNLFDLEQNLEGHGIALYPTAGPTFPEPVGEHTKVVQNTFKNLRSSQSAVAMMGHNHALIAGNTFLGPVEKGHGIWFRGTLTSGQNRWNAVTGNHFVDFGGGYNVRCAIKIPPTRLATTNSGNLIAHNQIDLDDTVTSLPGTRVEGVCVDASSASPPNVIGPNVIH